MDFFIRCLGTSGYAPQSTQDPLGHSKSLNMEINTLRSRRIYTKSLLSSALNTKKSPSTPFGSPVSKNSQTQLGFVINILASNAIAKWLFLTYNLVQLSVLFQMARFVYSWHIDFVHSCSKYGFAVFSLSMIPGMIVLPLITGFVVWPVFCVFRLVILRDSCQVESVQKHIDILKKVQSKVLSIVLDHVYDARRNAFDKVIKVPFDIKWLILKTMDRDYAFSKKVVLDQILKRTRKGNPTMSEWTRVLSFWALFTGVRDEYGIPTHIALNLEGFNLLVLCRDGFLVCLSCLLRFTIIVWMTR